MAAEEAAIVYATDPAGWLEDQVSTLLATAKKMGWKQDSTFFNQQKRAIEKSAMLQAKGMAKAKSPAGAGGATDDEERRSTPIWCDEPIDSCPWEEVEDAEKPWVQARSLLVDKVEPPFPGRKYQNDMAAPGGAAAGRARYICFKDSSRKEWGPRLCLLLNETVGVDGAPY